MANRGETFALFIHDLLFRRTAFVPASQAANCVFTPARALQLLKAIGLILRPAAQHTSARGKHRRELATRDCQG